MTNLWKGILIGGAAAVFAVITFFWVSSNQQKDSKKQDKQVLKNEQKFNAVFGTDPFFVADKKQREANAKKPAQIEKEIQELDGELKALDQTNKDVIADTKKSLHDANAAAQKDVSTLDKQMKERLKGGN